jgi:hypothetical protein
MSPRPGIVAVLITLAGALPAGASPGPWLWAEAELGYHAGAGAAVAIAAERLAPGFPLGLRLGLGRATRNPGDAAEARSIFINDATNGTPQESGRLWTYRLDLFLPLRAGATQALCLGGGPRHTRFTGNFKYIGGNEDFDVTAHQWGFGLLLGSRHAIGGRTRLVFTGGIDYYLDATLQGHDTAYRPDDDHVNPRKDYGYEEADEAINQPELELRLMAGVAYRIDR